MADHGHGRVIFGFWILSNQAYDTARIQPEAVHMRSCSHYSDVHCFILLSQLGGRRLRVLLYEQPYKYWHKLFGMEHPHLENNFAVISESEG